jgi:hypothetical protein
MWQYQAEVTSPRQAAIRVFPCVWSRPICSRDRCVRRGAIPTAHCASACTLLDSRFVHGSHRARIRTCRSSCSRSNVRPESDRCTMGGYTIQAYRRGRTCPVADHGTWSGRKLATTLAGRRRQTVAASRLYGHLASADRASPLANSASKVRLNAEAASALSITIKSLSWRLRPDAEKFAAPVRSHLPSIW